MNKSIIWSLVTIAILSGVGFWLIKSNQVQEAPVVANFEDCVDAGYSVMESYPRQCRNEVTGELFVEESTTGQSPKPTRNVGTGGCYVGGCSSQICSTDPNVVTTCEFKEEYACYNEAKCERQASGQCGWTETPELNICLSAVLNPNTNIK